jgi:hypothetical protein
MAGGLATAQEQRIPISKSPDICPLDATPYGQQVKANGVAVKGTRGDLQVFGLNLTAQVPDNAVYVVSLFDGDRYYLAGSITMFLGVGQMKLFYGGNGTEQPNALPPASEIRQVFVSDLVDVLAAGLCGPPDAPP